MRNLVIKASGYEDFIRSQYGSDAELKFLLDETANALLPYYQPEQLGVKLANADIRKALLVAFQLKAEAERHIHDDKPYVGYVIFCRTARNILFRHVRRQSFQPLRWLPATFSKELSDYAKTLPSLSPIYCRIGHEDNSYVVEDIEVSSYLTCKMVTDIIERKLQLIVSDPQIKRNLMSELSLDYVKSVFREVSEKEAQLFSAQGSDKGHIFVQEEPLAEYDEHLITTLESDVYIALEEIRRIVNQANPDRANMRMSRAKLVSAAGESVYDEDKWSGPELFASAMQPSREFFAASERLGNMETTIQIDKLFESFTPTDIDKFVNYTFIEYNGDSNVVKRQVTAEKISLVKAYLTRAA